VSTDDPDIVVGTLYGSAVGLFLAMAAPLLLVTVPLASAGIWNWATPAVLVIASAAATPGLRRRSTLTVSDEGVTLLRAGTLAFVPWSNVASMSGRWFPTLVFREPQRVGLRTTGRLRFGGFDPRWRSRRTSTAIAREFARSRTANP